MNRLILLTVAVGGTVAAVSGIAWGLIIGGIFLGTAYMVQERRLTVRRQRAARLAGHHHHDRSHLRVVDGGKGTAA